MINNNAASTKTAIKIFLPWQDEDEEKWLEKMSTEGWQLVSAIPFFYTFQKVSPKLIVVRLDYKSSWDKDYQEYLTVFRDAGWSLQTTLGNWHYFSINPQNGVVPEIYNSNRAKAQKYRRVLLGLSPILLCIVGPLASVLNFSNQSSTSDMGIGLKLIFLSTVLLFIYSFLRVSVKLILLKTNNRE
jgi:hypothetical protein